jgi:hypothetical protein
MQADELLAMSSGPETSGRRLISGTGYSTFQPK